MRILRALNAFRVALGEFVKGLSLFIFGLIFLSMFAFILAFAIDFVAWDCFGASTNIRLLFYSGVYSRNDMGYEGFAAGMVLGIIAGLILYAIGWLIAIGENKPLFDP